MRIAVISDIHANLQALRAAAADAAGKADAYWFLGDLFGRGPEPYGCWEYLTKRLQIPDGSWVAGNHDWGIVNRLDEPLFMMLDGGANGYVGDFVHDWPVLRRQRAEFVEFSPDVLAFTERLPLIASPMAGVYLAHGVVDTKARKCVGHYGRTMDDVEGSLQAALTMLPSLQIDAVAGASIKHSDPLVKRVELSVQSSEEIHPVVCSGVNWTQPRLILVGHTHVACAWQRKSGVNHLASWFDYTSQLNTKVASDDPTLWFENLAEQPVFANPGSVGFPRDMPPGHACYLLVDWQQDRLGLTLRRVSYDPMATIQQMRNLGTPESLINLLRSR